MNGRKEGSATSAFVNAILTRKAIRAATYSARGGVLSLANVKRNERNLLEAEIAWKQFISDHVGASVFSAVGRIPNSVDIGVLQEELLDKIGSVHLRIEDASLDGRFIDTPWDDAPPELREWLIRKYGPVVYVPTNPDETYNSPKDKADDTKKKLENTMAEDKRQKAEEDKQSATKDAEEHRQKAAKEAQAAKEANDATTREKHERQQKEYEDMAVAKEKEANAKRNKESAITAAAEHSSACNKSVKQAADKSGAADLPAVKANEQIDYMENNWDQVDSREAQRRANNGEFGVAGLKNDSGSGHVAVIVEGRGATKPDKKFYPNVAGGASNPVARSYGDATAGDVWSRKDRAKVKYYFPKP